MTLSPDDTLSPSDPGDAPTAYSGPTWSIVTSMRSDPGICDRLGGSPLYLLSLHRDRILDAAHDFGWHGAKEILAGENGIQNLKDAVESCWVENLDKDLGSRNKSYKIRLLMDPKGEFTVTATEVPHVGMNNLFPKDFSALDFPSESTSWKVFISPVRTAPTIFTKHKTTHREIYDEVRKYVPSWALDTKSSVIKGTMCEILLVNTGGEIMEGSITTPYFFRGGRWVTPPSTSGGNIGTTRRWALDLGLCVEGVVSAKGIKIGEAILLSNGVRGWGSGVVVDRQEVQRTTAC